jgi:hypothetical protein
MSWFKQIGVFDLVIIPPLRGVADDVVENARPPAPRVLREIIIAASVRKVLPDDCPFPPAVSCYSCISSLLIVYCFR